MSAASTAAAAATSATTAGVSLPSTTSIPNVSCSTSTDAIAAAAGLPHHIFKTILESPKIQDPPCEIVSVEECPSAQQQVFVVRLRPCENHHEETGDETVPLNVRPGHRRKKVAKQAVVVRIWKGGARWWNLHRNESVEDLATAEMLGYYFAHQAFVFENSRSVGNRIRHVIIRGDDGADEHEDEGPRVPEVLESHHLSKQPWAILQYVGPGSSLFQKEKNDCDESQQQQQSTPPYRKSTSYMTGMVKIRHEFGFEEPHPRWGRVPADQALEYARLVLNQVVLPLHHYFFSMFGMSLPEEVQTYGKMVQKYQRARQDLKVSVHHYMTPSYCETDKFGNKNCMMAALNSLDDALIVLENNEYSIPPMFAPVMVHLDLQPQNLIFGTKDGDCPGHVRILAVLDWEDAARADPRFELLLLCRKVCANREDADALWSEYSLWYATETSKDLGPIQPWLQLETVHSICTLLLQSMDLLSGGRNPWETKSDLWGKVEREFARWEQW